jgi:hypothetical protein
LFFCLKSKKGEMLMFAQLIDKIPLLAALSRLSAGSRVNGADDALPPNPVGTGSVVQGWGSLPIEAPSEKDVRCHFCEDLILVGDAVTLYCVAIADPQRPVAFHTCRNGTRSIIGCARKPCANGAERAGTLTPFAGTLVPGADEP